MPVTLQGGFAVGSPAEHSQYHQLRSRWRRKPREKRVSIHLARTASRLYRGILSSWTRRRSELTLFLLVSRGHHSSWGPRTQRGRANKQTNKQKRWPTNVALSEIIAGRGPYPTAARADLLGSSSPGDSPDRDTNAEPTEPAAAGGARRDESDLVFPPPPTCAARHGGHDEDKSGTNTRPPSRTRGCER